jgi:hypothetical protein
MVVPCLGEWKIRQEIDIEVMIESFVSTLHLHLCMVKACSSVNIRVHYICEYDFCFAIGLYRKTWIVCNPQNV